MNYIEIERYARLYPDMTTRELVDMIKKENEDAYEKERVRQEDEMKWFEDLIGNYVSINHSNVSFTIFYVDKMFDKGICTTFNVFDVYRSDNEGRFSIQRHSRQVNKYWLTNPYLIRTVGESPKMKIITKEEYNKIEELYKTFNEQLKNLDI